MRDLWMDRLSDYLDDDMPRSEAVDLEAHLATCDACRATLDELRRVKEQASSLVDPPVPDDLWAGIATRLGVAGPTGDAAAPRRPRLFALPLSGRRFTFSMPQLAAAAFLLVVGSAAAFWSLRGSMDRQVIAGRSPAPAESSSHESGTSLAAFDAKKVESDIADLQRALERGRGKLDPTTLQVLEKNLELIRVATLDAERALAADPANPALREYIAGNVERKLDFVKRATQMAGI